MSAVAPRKVLIIEASPNGEQSLSNKGSALVIDALKKRYGSLDLKVRDLQKNPVPHLTPEHIQAMFTLSLIHI